MRTWLRAAGIALLPVLALPFLALADGYDRIAAKVVVGSKAYQLRRIAVLEFPYLDNRAGEGPRAVQEGLTMRLAARAGLELVEPGRSLDADAVLTGTLQDLPGGRVRINARLVRLPDGVIVGAATAAVKRSWSDPQAPPSRSPAAWLKDILAPPEACQGREEIAALIRERFDALRK